MGYTGFSFLKIKTMKNKEFKIQIPEGYEIDKENSTFECIKFKPKPELTYDDIAKKLFLHNDTYYLGSTGTITKIDMGHMNYSDSNNSVSKRQCERLLAINKLINVAYYFNEIVNKDLNEIDHYYFTVDDYDILTSWCAPKNYLKTGIVYFKTKESIREAMRILGEETIKLAINISY